MSLTMDEKERRSGVAAQIIMERCHANGCSPKGVSAYIPPDSTLLQFKVEGSCEGCWLKRLPTARQRLLVEGLE